MLACYVAWFLIYEGLIAPSGRIDEWLSLRVAAQVTGLLNVLGIETFMLGRHVWIDGFVGVLVVDGCNGLSSLGLFSAFILAYPGSWRRRLWFIPLGLVAIHLVNVARIAGLLVVQARAPAMFDFSHQVGMTVIFYAAIFLLWVVWVRMGDAQALHGHTAAAVAT